VNYSLLVGLGNPGEEYKGTRHNAGYMVADIFANTYSARKWKRARSYASVDIRIKGGNFTVLKPTTYMNLSGKAVASVMRLKEVNSSQMIIVHDDMDLPVGKIKVKKDGGSGGHKGLESIFQEILSRDFTRVRIGIGHPPMDEPTIDYVLASPGLEDSPLFAKSLQLGADAVESLIFYGASATMNRYNKAETDTKCEGDSSS
jgi:peptidyl-tRNA hydrolase, PTH1 family